MVHRELTLTNRLQFAQEQPETCISHWSVVLHIWSLSAPFFSLAKVVFICSLNIWFFDSFMTKPLICWRLSRLFFFLYFFFPFGSRANTFLHLKSQKSSYPNFILLDVIHIPSIMCNSIYILAVSCLFFSFICM